MSKHSYEPIKNYINFEDYLEKAGYKQYKPKVGSLGRALIEASKHQGRSSFLNKMLDGYFKKLRQKKKKQKEQQNKNVIQKQNSRHHLQSNASNNNKKCISSSSESNGCTANG